MKKDKKNKKKEDSVFSGNQVMMMLEQVMDNISILAESHQALKNKMDGKFDGLEQRFDGLEQRFDGLEQRFDKFEKETGDNFRSVFEYLSRIEDEIVDIKQELKRLQKNKADRNEVLDLMRRVEVLEKKIAGLEKQEAFGE
jgi:hypothetical protein